MSKYNLDSLLLETLSAILRRRTELTRLLIALWQHLTKDNYLCLSHNI